MQSNQIKFIQLNRYIHIYRVGGLNNWLQSEKDLITEESKGPTKEGLCNFNTTSELINEGFHSLMMDLTLKYYVVGENQWDMGNHTFDPRPMIYYQTKENFTSLFHNHYDHTTITATTYIDPLDKEHGGGLELFFHDKYRPIIYPEPDCIYVFPSWVLHRPLPHSIDVPRLCINWGFNCSVRPIHKLTGDRW